MITENYVSFKIAKLLKEKGFNELCFRLINEDGEIVEAPSQAWNGMTKRQKAQFYLCPTHQMACKWFRDVHKLLISVDASPIYGKVKDDKGKNTCGLLYWHYMASGVWLNEEYSPYQRIFVVSGESYEEAVEAALKYSLENLLK